MSMTSNLNATRQRLRQLRELAGHLDAALAELLRQEAAGGEPIKPLDSALLLVDADNLVNQVRYLIGRFQDLVQGSGDPWFTRADEPTQTRAVPPGEDPEPRRASP